MTAPWARPRRARRLPSSWCPEYPLPRATPSNAFQAEEIDIAFWNEGGPAGLQMFDRIVLVECKRWTAPAGYPELALFNDDKLTSRGRPMGIFVAAAGITGGTPL
jgi:hypothetical protein